MEQTLTVAIDQLPYELLSHIFDRPDVSNETLFSMSLTCKRMHYFLLPIFLARFEILNPTERSEVVFRNTSPGTVDALSGLKASLFVSSIKQLVCRFEFAPDTANYRMVIHHTRRLYDLVSTLTAVENVKFIMGNDQCGCCSASLSGELLDAALIDWSTTIGRTWSKIIEKKCVSLTIIGGRYMGHTYTFNAGRNIGKQKASFMGIKNILSNKRSDATLRQEEDIIDLLQSKNWRFQRAIGYGTTIILTPLYSPAKEHAVLRCLTLSSIILMVPPLLHWAISVLRLPSVEALHIKNVSVNRKCWHAVFSVISQHAPHLKEIRLSCIRQLVPADLLHFLSKLPNLEALHLGRSVECVDAFNLGAFSDFPRLQMLHAPAGWVLKLLVAQRKGLESLKKLSIVYNMRNDGLSHWIQRSSLPSIPVLLKEQHRSLSISLRIHLGSTPGWRMTDDVESVAEDELTLDQPGLGDVTGLVLVFDELLDEDDIPLAGVLPKWLSLFFGLRYLAIKTSHPLANTQASELVVTDLVVGMLKEGGLAEIASVEVNDVMVTSDGVVGRGGAKVSVQDDVRNSPP
ncbi:hypothetical protein HYPSUDRAFT_33720 [Hypholoma sublateritium FD-334 SS-4]|uniref:F-box domain-containing protein n=1 Tax=Hypholoma sublateritium (strain FD-334 SS-4) TaxID=945553 RepID=A0A0D2Q9L5_HYPSF|nr:hypothetical protein HYPSUDRAFT_33720 [Hypholoma sublateritium FD-334 SS-4]